MPARALATFPALRCVNMPAGAAIVAVHAAPSAKVPAATLLVECDPAAAPVERQFIVARPGAALPPNAGFVGSYRNVEGALTAVYELHRSDVPADLHPDRHEDYRLLLREGYGKVLAPDCTYHAWRAPNGLPPGNMSLGAMEAVARLQEHGYGPVVDA